MNAKFRKAICRSLLGAGLGVLCSMAFLRIRHEGAFRTEFKTLLWLTVIQAALVAFLLTLLFSQTRPTFRNVLGIVKCVGAVILGGLTALLIAPSGFILVISGQAFITSGIATLAYSALSNVRNE